MFFVDLILLMTITFGALCFGLLAVWQGPINALRHCYGVLLMPALLWYAMKQLPSFHSYFSLLFFVAIMLLLSVTMFTHFRFVILKLLHLDPVGKWLNSGNSGDT